MDIDIKFIWDDDKDTTVFVEAAHESLRLLFRIKIDHSTPTSTVSRIVTCFHDIGNVDQSKSFEDRSTMRKAIKYLLWQIWQECAQTPDIGAPHSVITIKQDLSSRVFPVIEGCQEYDAWKDSLPDLKVFEAYGQSRPDYKTYLQGPSDFPARRHDWLHEIKTLEELPPHPNIAKPPELLVIVPRSEDLHSSAAATIPGSEDLHGSTTATKNTRVCGSLTPFLSNGSMDDFIEGCRENNTLVSTSDKVRWCYQMSLAVRHTHCMAHTYHMDIKPGNILIDDQKNLLLSDWEQRAATMATLAPEADGTWDVEYEHESSQSASMISTPRLVYKLYTGPPRENMEFSRISWNVFPSWHKQCPEALAAAEVFSLGRTMWMLMEEKTFDEAFRMTADNVIWTEASDSMPKGCREAVMDCLNTDPNARSKLDRVVDFWADVESR